MSKKQHNDPFSDEFESVTIIEQAGPLPAEPPNKFGNAEKLLMEEAAEEAARMLADHTAPQRVQATVIIDDEPPRKQPPPVTTQKTVVIDDPKPAAPAPAASPKTVMLDDTKQSPALSAQKTLTLDDLKAQQPQPLNALKTVMLDEARGQAAAPQPAAPSVSMTSNKTEILTDSHPRPLTPPPPPQPKRDQTAPPSATPKTEILGDARPSSSSSSASAAASPPPNIAPTPVAKGKLAPGTRVNQYEIIRELGEGGMGTVSLARDTKLGRRVAIKFLSSSNAELTRRFIIEAQATARCSHENIVIIYEVGEFEGSPFMVLEFLQGRPLDIEGTQRLSPTRSVELITPVLRALACAHELGIVHRDLKPDNIFLTDLGSVKVLDFGIAKVLQGDGSEDRGLVDAAAGGAPASQKANATRVGAIMGTPAYMAPEQWGINVGIDHRADIWAVGIMLFRMLAGKHPLDPLSGMQLIVTAMLNQPMPSLREAAPDLPTELCDVVDKCLKKKKEERYNDVRELLRALEPFQPGRYQANRKVNVEESPYAGLSSFQETDAGRFFGRNHEVAAMVMRLRDRPLIAAVGPSGVGKSSLVRAGVVPALKTSGEKWETLVVRPGRAPLSALAALANPLMGTGASLDADLDEQKKMTARLAEEPGFLGNLLRGRARRTGQNIMVFVDQFEELYTLVPDHKERAAFTQCLSGVADDPTSPTRVVVSIRSDFLDRVSEDPHFMNDLGQGLFFINPPSHEGLRDALVQPAEMAGYRFENAAMVEEMIGHLSSASGALPLLQFTASKLWEKRDPVQRLLTESSYRAIGGIAGALAAHADQVVEKLPHASQTLVRALFLRLITGERTRAIVSLDDLGDLTKDRAELQSLVDQLVNARLLVVQTGGGGGGATVEIVHESLIHTWPRLKRWLDESGEDSAFMEQLRTAARQWHQKNRPRDLLWRGDLVEEARRFQRRYRGELPDIQVHFLRAVFDLSQRAERIRRIAVVSGLGFLMILLAAAGVALFVIQDAKKAADQNAAEAKLSAQQAQQRLEEVQRAEHERLKATVAQKTAETAKAQADEKVVETNAELQRKNADLEEALKNAEEAKKHATEAQANAEQNAEAAKKAQAEAQKAAKELQTMLAREQERVHKLQDQLGSPVMDVLK